ncbi:helix-turn-helix transcriptional regulator [Marinicella sp. W31]|uniref:helix-turn-helix transcriptional regulator n=1 Tax=Marinicella sp. W31 TaxID=3023713 RepID=UPI0037563FD8
MEEILFSSDIVQIGHFVLPRDHPSFAQPGYVQSPIFVFPKNSIWIQHEYGEAFVADTSLVNFYNADQVYRRDVIHPEGDNCHWFALAPPFLAEVLNKKEHPQALFDVQYMACNRAAFIAHLRVLESVEVNGVDENLLIEEQVLDVLKLLMTPVGDNQKQVLSVKAKHRKLIERVKQSLQESLGVNLSLQQLAEQHHTSPFHLSRLFKKVCGYGISAYRNEQRMRTAAIRIAAGEEDLASLAFNLGYSSHSHLTATFKQYYGFPPRHFQHVL